MIANYYTIACIASEIRNSLSGAVLGTPFTQSKNELVIPVLEGQSKESGAIVISCEPSRSFVVRKDRFDRARRNSADIFPSVSGRTLMDVLMHPADREFSLLLSGNAHLVARLYGSSSNVYYVGEGELESFLATENELNTSRLLPFPDSVPDPNAIGAALREPVKDVSVEQLVRTTMPTLGSHLVRECLYRTGIVPAAEPFELGPDARRRLAETVTAVISNLTAAPPSPLIYYKEEVPVCFSIMPLDHLAGLKAEPQISVSRGILRFLSRKKSLSGTSKRKASIVSLLSAESERGGRALARMEGDATRMESPDHLEKLGKLLQAHLFEVSKGLAEVTVPDFIAGGDVLTTIPLDIHLTPSRNVERYFEQARRVRRKLEEQAARKKKTSGRLLRISTLLLEAGEIASEEEAMAFALRYSDEFPGLRPLSGKNPAKRDDFPFRRFFVEGDFEVWVGKNSHNNDLLSTRHTAKNDLWFHARGSGGSHVVLKRGTGRGDIGRRAIEQAAAIAAYYSKMKKAKYVPVSVCEGKFVRKPRGADPGAVVIEREEVLLVTPVLPAPRGD